MKINFKDAITGNDNSVELIFVGVGVALLVGLFLAGYDVIKLQHPFDWEKFGNGIGWMFGGAGLGYGGKKFGDHQSNAPDSSDNTLTTTETSASSSTTTQPIVPTPIVASDQQPAAPATPAATTDQPQA